MTLKMTQLCVWLFRPAAKFGAEVLWIVAYWMWKPRLEAESCLAGSDDSLCWKPKVKSIVSWLMDYLQYKNPLEGLLDQKGDRTLEPFYS